jgi:hypothetical protein
VDGGNGVPRLLHDGAAVKWLLIIAAWLIVVEIARRVLKNSKNGD